MAVSIHSSDTHTRTGARTHARTVQRRRRKHPLLLLSQLLLPQRVRAATLVVMFSSAVVHYDKRGPGRLPQCRAPSSPGYRDRDRAVTTMVVPCECAPGLVWQLSVAFWMRFERFHRALTPLPERACPGRSCVREAIRLPVPVIRNSIRRESHAAQHYSTSTGAQGLEPYPDIYRKACLLKTSQSHSPSRSRCAGFDTLPPLRIRVLDSEVGICDGCSLAYASSHSFLFGYTPLSPSLPTRLSIL